MNHFQNVMSNLMSKPSPDIFLVFEGQFQGENILIALPTICFKTDNLLWFTLYFYQYIRNRILQLRQN